ncbi:MAG: hypothetical protein V1692_00640 [bacterium]
MKINSSKIFFTFLLVLFSSFLIIPLAQAVDTTVNFQPAVPIQDAPSGQVDNNTLGNYIKAVYKYGVLLGSTLAIIVIMFGGIIWLTSGGSPERVKNAQTYIGGALGGLILLLGSYMLLDTINPDLTKLSLPEIKQITGVGADKGWTGTWICCGLKGDPDSAIWVQSKKECEDRKLEIPGSFSVSYSVQLDTFCAGVDKPYIGVSEMNAGSPNLIKLVDCIKKEPTRGSYEPQYYVDSNIGTTCINVCTKDCPSYNKSTKTGCHHVCTSDHYGCKCDGVYSYAADLSTKDPNTQCDLAQAAASCSDSTGVGIKEMRASQAAKANCSLPSGFNIIADGSHEDHIHIAVNCNN